MKSSKTYIVDSGLLSWLLLLTPERLARQPALLGHLFENFVVMELQKQITWNKVPVKMYHFRSTDGKEVDVVMERQDGKLLGIEVKTGRTITPKDTKGLVYLKEQVGDAWHRGIVLYTGDIAFPLGDGMIALPISALWAF